MINSVNWTEIRDDGYPERDMDVTNEICLIKCGTNIYQAIWCDVGKQWLSTDCRPFYQQWKITSWVFINK